MLATHANHTPRVTGGVFIKSLADFDRLACGCPRFAPHPGKAHRWAFYGWRDPANNFVSFIVLPAHAIELDQCIGCGAVEERKAHPKAKRYPRSFR